MASHRAADGDRREAFLLKQLQGLAAWQGSLVHKGIQKYIVPSLALGSSPDRDDVIDQTLAMAERQVAFSQSGGYRVDGRSKRSAGDSYCALFEHEYDIPVTEEKLQEIYETVSQCLRNLLDQKGLIDHLKYCSGHRSEYYSDFRLGGVRVLALLDLLCFQERRAPVIIDWKVGKSDGSDYSYQVMTYALCILKSPMCVNMRAEDVSVYEVNLLKNQVKQHAVTEEKLIKAENFIFRSIEQIKAVGGEEPYESQHIEDYEVARSWMTCMYCNFRKLCMRVNR